MGKHRRPGPPNQPSHATARIDPDNPLAAYEKRRQPPLEGPHRHRPLSGGAPHMHPNTPRVLQVWDGFAYAPVGIAPNLAAAQAWARKLDQAASTDRT